MINIWSSYPDTQNSFCHTWRDSCRHLPTISKHLIVGQWIESIKNRNLCFPGILKEQWQMDCNFFFPVLLGWQQSVKQKHGGKSGTCEISNFLYFWRQKCRNILNSTQTSSKLNTNVQLLCLISWCMLSFLNCLTYDCKHIIIINNIHILCKFCRSVKLSAAHLCNSSFRLSFATLHLVCFDSSFS